MLPDHCLAESRWLACEPQVSGTPRPPEIITPTVNEKPDRHVHYWRLCGRVIRTTSVCPNLRAGLVLRAITNFLLELTTKTRDKELDANEPQSDQNFT